MAKDIIAIYKDPAAAAVAISRLEDAGLSKEDISVLMAETTRGREFTVDAETKAPEGAVAGGVAGGALGGIAAALVAVGAIAAPGIGLVAAGPLLATLAGVGAGGAVGGLAGGLSGMGIPEHEVNLLSDQVSEGAVLLGAHVHDDRREDTIKIFEDTGGKNIRG